MRKSITSKHLYSVNHSALHSPPHHIMHEINVAIRLLYTHFYLLSAFYVACESPHTQISVFLVPPRLRTLNSNLCSLKLHSPLIRLISCLSRLYLINIPHYRLVTMEIVRSTPPATSECFRPGPPLCVLLSLSLRHWPRLVTSNTALLDTFILLVRHSPPFPTSSLFSPQFDACSEL